MVLFALHLKQCLLTLKVNNNLKLSVLLTIRVMVLGASTWLSGWGTKHMIILGSLNSTYGKVLMSYFWNTSVRMHCDAFIFGVTIFVCMYVSKTSVMLRWVVLCVIACS